MTRDILFDPVLPWPVLIALSVCFLAAVAVSIWRRLPGWPLRALAFAAIAAFLSGPSVLEKSQNPLPDIVVVVVDETSSIGLADRRAQQRQALQDIRATIATLPNTELYVHRLSDASDNRGTLLKQALNDVVDNLPRGQIAGAILLSDGQAHDMDIGTSLPAPLHLFLTGSKSDWDRRLIIRNAPSFAILDEEITLTLEVENQGNPPQGVAETTELFVSIDGEEPLPFTIPVGRELKVPLVLPHGGMNVIQFTIPEAQGELTTRNNSSVIQINGVRDRLRVLLVSGEPHNGERTWRNLLKSDASVDLVHFTILRPPTKQDGVPVTELSLIAFPTRELFLEKVDDFDLIIFDRYKLRGILPPDYLDNIARYVEDGGAVLFAAGPDFASVNSLFRTPLSRVIPVTPTGRVYEEGFKPELTDIGRKHPVTEELATQYDADTPRWGRWFRQVDVDAGAASVVMSGIDERPLLALSREGEGRVAVLASDHAWLWARGVEGGGPQLELLRRLAHWLMKEPELEEESLSASAEGALVTITRRSLEEGARNAIVRGPDGFEASVPLAEISPGKFIGTLNASDMGLYRIEENGVEAVVVVGPAAPKEFEETVATPEKAQATLDQFGGGVFWMEDRFPRVRLIGENRTAAGETWFGITPRQAFVSSSSRLDPVLPTWLWLVLIAGLSLAAWLREGRR